MRHLGGPISVDNKHEWHQQGAPLEQSPMFAIEKEILDILEY